MQNTHLSEYACNNNLNKQILFNLNPNGVISCHAN